MHDCFWSNVSTVISTAFEVAFIELVWKHSWTAAAAAAPWWGDWRTVAWLLTMPYWRIAHFYAVHRVMHAWKIPGVPDVGMFLYRHVHSLHHRSKNPVRTGRGWLVGAGVRGGSAAAARRAAPRVGRQ